MGKSVNDETSLILRLAREAKVTILHTQFNSRIPTDFRAPRPCDEPCDELIRSCS